MSIILSKRSWINIFSIFSATAIILSVILWGITQAEISQNQALSQASPNFSSYGEVQSIDASTLVLIHANDPEGGSDKTYTIDITGVSKIEKKNYESLSILQINTGDKIIVQALQNGSSIQAARIVSFATSTPWRTLAATTTPEAASTSEATTTPTMIEKIVDVIQTVVLAIVDTIAGSSTASVATSTPEAVTATPEAASTTPVIEEATSTPAETPIVSTESASSAEEVLPVN